ncbi:MAG: hypothetical protein PHC62_01790 [Candidatus Izemoplasmatales bacterium]|jgi:hypothetical protein|nr:hypothetical protein [Candidatus Izemoplasmatales bacterium]
MTKILKTSILLSFVLLLSILFIGCSTETDGLALFQKTISANIDVSSSLDPIDETDLSEAIITDLGAYLLETRVENLAFSIELTPYEKVQEIKSLHAQIVSTHVLIVATRNNNAIAFETIKRTIATLRENKVTINEEDKITIQAWTTELKENKLILQGTIGKAFAQMRDLRGTYTIENIDHILATYIEVAEVLQLRLDSIQRVFTILTEANILLQQYME